MTTVAFDETGNYLAVGDKAGRVCIFQETERSCQSFKQAGAGGEDGDDGKDQRSQAFSPIEYKFYMEFQSHDAELDSLKNVSIDERISMIQWGKATNNAQFILSTNDRSIKLWKVHDRIYRRPIRGPSPAPGTYGELVLPKLSKSAPAPTATRKRVFTGAHSCPINSISLNSDGATFLSADECYIHIWSLDDVTECYSTSFPFLLLLTSYLSRLHSNHSFSLSPRTFYISLPYFSLFSFPPSLLFPSQTLWTFSRRTWRKSRKSSRWPRGIPPPAASSSTHPRGDPSGSLI